MNIDSRALSGVIDWSPRLVISTSLVPILAPLLPLPQYFYRIGEPEMAQRSHSRHMQCPFMDAQVGF